MESPPKPFPLTRFIHYGNFKHYYAFGNTPAEDFLRSVAADPATPTRPTILSLGCGDIRSCMYTLWKNFGFEGKSVSGFAGVDFVLNDCSAAVLARDVLFLYLCLCMPEDGASRAKKEWVASVWSIWYNHELTPKHDEVLTRALAQLLQWSETVQEWAQCRLGVMVRFSSLDTFREVKQMWALWHGRGVKVESVESMKIARRDFQTRHFQKRAIALNLSTNTSEIMEGLARGLLSPLRFHSDYPQEKIDAMTRECSAYSEGGSAFAETVLGLRHSTGKTSVNMTLFERSNGSYTLQYELVPYTAFHLAVLYSPAEVSKMTSQSEAALPVLPVTDKYFKIAPLLANCVQQFNMWLTATANMMKQSENCKVLFIFDCSDAISFCQTLSQFPEQYPHILDLSGPPLFDAIYTSNLLDPLVGASTLVLVTVPLLKPSAALFTTAFQYKEKGDTSNEYIEKLFGFPPELLPVVLGIHCIGHDGQYSSTVAPLPIPPYADSAASLQPSHVFLVWKNVISEPIVISSLTDEVQLVSHLVRSCASTLSRHATFDSFLAIVHRFIATLHMKASPSYQFWEPFCKEIVKKPILKPHLTQLQTQSFLHGLHMHITVTKADCPLCTGQPLNEYIGGYKISLNASGACYGEPFFSVHLESGLDIIAVITSLAGSSNDSNVQLDFFCPKQHAEMFERFEVYEVYGEIDFPLLAGRLQDLSSCSCSKYTFMKHAQLPTTTKMQSSMGEIVKHSGDATRFETVVSITEVCTTALEKEKLTAERTEACKLQVRCGQELHMTITYPYPIQSNVHIKLSKKNKNISITAEREMSYFYSENPTVFVDSYNALALPQIQYGDKRIKFYYTLQTPLPNIDPAGHFYMKSVLFNLANRASDEHMVVAFPSKYIPGNPDIYGMIIVHSIHFDPYFQSSVLNISFCFPQKLPKSSLSQVASFWQQLTRKEFSIIWVDDEKYNILNEALAYFTTTTRKMNRNPGIPPAMAKHKGWKYFQQALVYPLFANTQLLHVCHAIKSFPSTLIPSSSLPDVQSSTISSAVEQQSTKTQTKCTYCKKTQTNLKKCGHCGNAQYCGRECQTKHWKEHKTVCKVSDTETASSTSPLFSCAKCRKQTDLRRCSCHLVAYCSKECQKQDWPNHRDSCTNRRKEQSRQDEQNPQSQSEPTSVDPKLQDKESVIRCGKCSNCNKAVVQQLKWCPCHKAAYCSIECQRLNWPLHKCVCTSIKK